MSDLAALEAKWGTVCQKNQLAGHQPLIAICGPSGAGKSTLVADLSTLYPVFSESTVGNPYLTALLEGQGKFDAVANQRWFLAQISAAIASADREMPLVLDQDPAAIVFVYSRMFRDEGLMSESEYASLVEMLIEVEHLMLGWRSPRISVCLDAHQEVLRYRVISRCGNIPTPPLDWFSTIREYFHTLFRRLPNPVYLSTSEFSADEVARTVRRKLTFGQE